MLALINERAGQILDRQRIFEAVVDDIRVAFDAMRCIIYDGDPSAEAHVLAISEAPDVRDHFPKRFEVGNRWLKDAFAGSMVARRQITSDPRDAFLRSMRTGSAILAPLFIQGRVEHAMSLHFSRPDAFDENDRLFFRSVASHLALTLANAQVYEMERLRRTRAESLERVVRMLRDTRTIEEVVLVFAVTVSHELKLACVLYEVDRTKAVRRAVRTLEPNRAGAPARFDATHLLPVLERGELILSGKLAETERRRLFGSNPGAILPLRVDGAVWGFALFMDSSGTFDWNDIERNVYVRTLVSHLELALSAALGFERIQHLARALSESNEFKDDLLAMLAHDFKGPLTVIAGYCELLLEESPPETREELETIYTQTKRLVRLSEDALALAMTQASGFSLDRATLDLREVVEENIKARDRAGERIRFEAPDRPVPVSLDPARFNHVIDNLLMNALKYSEGDVVVRISLTDENASINITDRGIGIPQEELAHVFTRFGRATNARRQGISGSGVGLYVSRKIVEVHGGSIAVASTEGRGSTFTITLPLAEQPS